MMMMSHAGAGDDNGLSALRFQRSNAAHTWHPWLYAGGTDECSSDGAVVSGVAVVALTLGYDRASTQT